MFVALLINGTFSNIHYPHDSRQQHSCVCKGSKTSCLPSFSGQIIETFTATVLFVLFCFF